MPTIKQLPTATAVSGNDLIPVSQNGLTRGVTVNTLLGNTQPLLSLPQGGVLGRTSLGAGGPEVINLGTGLSLQSSTVVADGADHVSFTLSTSLLSGDEIVVNSGAAPKRLPATQLRSLFSAGLGIQIDSNGIISATGGSSSGGGGNTGPAGQGFTFRGPWQAATVYNAYDVVTFGGQTYLAAASVAPASSFNVSSWSLLAAQGAAGLTGATGATGAMGPVGPAGPTAPATATTVGAVKPAAGLTVATDGSLSISNVPLSALGQGNAGVGQILSWTGTGWAPTTPAAGVSYTGAAPISVASGVISLSQAGAAAGQVLAWNGTGWAPQQLPASGAPLGIALPQADGAASAGTATNASREDHRHPTDLTRAPIAAPVFTSSITLPLWTTTTRPAQPTPAMQGYATDTGRLETFTSSGWVQYVRLSDLPAATGQLLGSTSSGGAAAAIGIGSGLSLTNGTLSALASGNQAIVGVVVDGASVVASVSSPYQMGTADRVVDVTKTSGSPTKLLLPSNPTAWVEYTIIDGKGDAAINNITITGATGTTINGQPSFVMNANNDAVTLRAVSASVWRIV